MDNIGHFGLTTDLLDYLGLTICIGIVRVLCITTHTFEGLSSLLRQLGTDVYILYLFVEYL